MAQNADNILIGAANIYIDDYVAAGSPVASPTEVGHTRGPVTVTPAFTDYEIKSEQAASTIRRFPTDFTVTVKVPMIEATLDHWREALRQPSGNLTGDGSSTDKVLLVGLAQEQYHQVKILGPGLGSAGTREIWIWKGIVTEVPEYSITRESEQLLNVSILAAYDDSVATADKIMKVVDAIT